MKGSKSILANLLTVYCLSLVCVAQSYHFFYFVLQWPGSVCKTSESCCYPKTGKLAPDFTIRGLWPYNIDNTSWSSAMPNNSISPNVDYGPQYLTDKLQRDWPSLSCPISTDYSSFWSREWKQHGTCSAHILDLHKYFKAALDLKDKINLLQLLNNAGIKPDGKLYPAESMREAVTRALRYSPGIKCNADASGKYRQLYQVYICINPAGKEVIDCPGMADGHCTSMIKFPTLL